MTEVAMSKTKERDELGIPIASGFGLTTAVVRKHSEMGAVSKGEGSDPMLPCRWSELAQSGLHNHRHAIVLARPLHPSPAADTPDRHPPYRPTQFCGFFSTKLRTPFRKSSLP
jgi:hypothetical protein